MRIFIDIDIIKMKLHNEWDGMSYKGNFKRYLNSMKKEILVTVKNHIESLNLINVVAKYEIDLNEVQAVLYFESNGESDDISRVTYYDSIKEDFLTTSQYFAEKSINCYYR